MPTGEQQCQASRPGSESRSRAQAAENSYLSFQNPGPTCPLTPISRLPTPTRVGSRRGPTEKGGGFLQALTIRVQRDIEKKGPTKEL